MNPERILSNFTPDCEQEKQDRRRMLELLGEGRDLLASRQRKRSLHRVVVDRLPRPPSGTDGLPQYLSELVVDGRSCGRRVEFSARRPAGGAGGNVNFLRASAVRSAAVAGDSPRLAPHFKRGKFVCAHVHLNVTYLLEADPALPAARQARRKQRCALVSRRGGARRGQRALHARSLSEADGEGSRFLLTNRAA